MKLNILLINKIIYILMCEDIKLYSGYINLNTKEIKEIDNNQYNYYLFLSSSSCNVLSIELLKLIKSYAVNKFGLVIENSDSKNFFVDIKPKSIKITKNGIFFFNTFTRYKNLKIGINNFDMYVYINTINIQLFTLDPKLVKHIDVEPDIHLCKTKIIYENEQIKVLVLSNIDRIIKILDVFIYDDVDIITSDDDIKILYNQDINYLSNIFCRYNFDSMRFDIYTTSRMSFHLLYILGYTL
tara:strand:- start:40 stop:762 length:723 start_codon:yes stop_codon:yes gene_type:complete